MGPASGAHRRLLPGEEEEEEEEEVEETSSWFLIFTLLSCSDTAMLAWTRSLSPWFGVRVFIGVLQEWPRWSSTVAVVCAWLVFLVLLALCSILLSATTPWSSAAVLQLQFIDGRRHPCFCAVAIPCGPDCSENTRDSPVARRHGGRCSFRAGCTGSHVQVVGGTVVLPQFLLVEKIAVSFEVVDIPVAAQRPFPMVQPA